MNTFITLMRHIKENKGRINLALFWMPTLQGWRIIRKEQINVFGYEKEKLFIKTINTTSL